MKLAANIGLLFPELPPLERIAAAKATGFEGVELLFPYDLDSGAVRDAAVAAGIADRAAQLAAGRSRGRRDGFRRGSGS